MEDSKIVELYLAKNEDAILASQQQYGSYCYSIAYHILNSREDSEECLNDTWLKAWGIIPPQRPAKLGLFLGKITRNLSFDRYRQKKSLKRGGGEITFILDELDECVPSFRNVEQEAMDKELIRTVNGFLFTIPERECNIFLARYWYSNSLKVIADCFQMKENNVKASLFRNRKKLKRYLEKEGIVL